MTRQQAQPRSPDGHERRSRHWRRNNRQRLNRLLSVLFGRTSPRRQPLAADTRSILILRLNKRLGNILFLTPMLRSLAAGLPAATLDVVIQDAAQMPLLQSLPGVGRVWILPRSVAGVLGLLWRLHRRAYDLAIDPVPNSASNRIALALCGARQRLGFASDHQWLALSHASAEATSVHQALQSVELLRNAVCSPRFTAIEHLTVLPDAAARSAASSHWEQHLQGRITTGPVIGFFAQATGHKQLPASWWRGWRTQMQRLLPAATLVQICPPGVPALDPALPHVAIARLDELAAFMARLDVFVAADSGPMHLAAAAGAPVVGLFQATDPAHYAPLGANCTALAGGELTVERVAEHVHRALQQRTHAAHGDGTGQAR